MHVPFRSPLSPSLVAIALSLTIAGCTDAPMATAVDGIQMAKGGGKGPTVNATDPTGAPQGTTLDVRVLGNGFEEGAKVQLLLKGDSTGKVRTNSVKFVGRKELVANITIDLDADIALYDVQVIGPGGKKGIGTELFAVQKKGKPTSKKNSVLDEYWVFPDPVVEGGNLIHVVGTGNVTDVNAGVVYDYFFNGIRDDNAPSDAHYEYTYGGPPAQPVTSLPDGRWHVDIPWNGERGAGPFFDGDRPYRNMIDTDVDDLGSDPFAFDLRYIVGKNAIGGDQPQGIIKGGEPIGAAVGDVNSDVHGPQSVTSYATFLGDDPEGVVFLETVSVSSITCTSVTRQIGRGKNATTERVTSVSADFNIVFGFDGSVTIPTETPAPTVWAEMHLRDVTSGEISNRETVIPSEAEVSGTVGLGLPEGSSSALIEFVVDYVNPIGPFMMYSYDPEQNSNLGFATTAGFGGPTWSNGAPSSEAGDGRFPVAATPAVTVTCSN